MKIIFNLLIAILALGIIAKPLPEDCSSLSSSDSVDMMGGSSSITTDDIDTRDDSADTFDGADPTSDDVDTLDGADSTDDTSDDADPTSDAVDTPDDADPTDDSVDTPDSIDSTSDSVDTLDDNASTDSSADPSNDSTEVETRAVIEGLLSSRNLVADYTIQSQGAFGILSKEMAQLSTASSSLVHSVSDFSFNPSFANIYAVTVQLNAFSRAVISSTTTVRGLKAMTSSSDAAKVLDLFRPIMASLSTMTKGLVQKKDVLNSFGIGCIFQELLAYLLILICFLLELLLSLCKINASCVKELSKFHSDVKVSMGAAVAAFATQASKPLLL